MNDAVEDALVARGANDPSGANAVTGAVTAAKTARWVNFMMSIQYYLSVIVVARKASNNTREEASYCTMLWMANPLPITTMDGGWMDGCINSNSPSTYKYNKLLFAGTSPPPSEAIEVRSPIFLTSSFNLRAKQLKRQDRSRYDNI
jgi:hypothetical protein